MQDQLGFYSYPSEMLIVQSRIGEKEKSVQNMRDLRGKNKI